MDAPYSPSTMVVNGKELKLVALLGEGIISSVHKVEDGSRDVFAKIARNPRDNDLLER